MKFARTSRHLVTLPRVPYADTVELFKYDLFTGRQVGAVLTLPYYGKLLSLSVGGADHGLAVVGNEQEDPFKVTLSFIDLGSMTLFNSRTLTTSLPTRSYAPTTHHVVSDQVAYLNIRDHGLYHLQMEPPAFTHVCGDVYEAMPSR